MPYQVRRHGQVYYCHEIEFRTEVTSSFAEHGYHNIEHADMVMIGAVSNGVPLGNQEISMASAEVIITHIQPKALETILSREPQE